jgi:hypothetical protein
MSPGSEGGNVIQARRDPVVLGMGVGVNKLSSKNQNYFVKNCSRRSKGGVQYAVTARGSEWKQSEERLIRYALQHLLLA